MISTSDANAASHEGAVMLLRRQRRGQPASEALVTFLQSIQERPAE
jgi:hypothetical protein